MRRLFRRLTSSDVPQTRNGLFGVQMPILLLRRRLLLFRHHSFLQSLPRRFPGSSKGSIYNGRRHCVFFNQRFHLARSHILDFSPLSSSFPLQRITNIAKAELPRCPAGPRSIQLEGDECPLHVQHPPTGEEFALGCGVCRNAHTF